MANPIMPVPAISSVAPIEGVPDMTPVLSSNVAAVGYDKGAQTLHVAFKNGGHYAYQGVSPTQHADVLAAPSVGSHLRARVFGKFNHEKLR